MGCGTSKVSNVEEKPEKSSVVTINTNKELNKPEDFEESDIRDSLNKTYDFLVNRIKSIKYPKIFSPPLVYTNISTPIFVSIINKENNIRLPIVSAVSHYIARILCFASYEMLSINIFKCEDTGLFFRNCFDWLFSSSQQKTPILFIGFPDEMQEGIKRCLASQTFTPQFGTLNSKLNDVKCIAITTDIDISRHKNTLTSFLANGGGIAFFYKDNADHANDFLETFGIQFTNINLLGNVEGLNISSVPRNVNLVKYSTFHRLCSEYIYQIGKNIDDLDPKKIIELSSTLNYYLEPIYKCCISCKNKIHELLNKSNQFLEENESPDKENLNHQAFECVNDVVTNITEKFHF